MTRRWGRCVATWSAGQPARSRPRSASSGRIHRGCSSSCTGLSDLGGFYADEKLAPFLSLFTVSGEDEGLTLSRRLLQAAGAGHTAIIHTTNAARVERFARAMPAGRILVNSPAAQGCCGMTTGLQCSLTLGCGTFGGNSTTDNVTYRHLLNIKRVAYHIEKTPQASSEAV